MPFFPQQFQIDSYDWKFKMSLLNYVPRMLSWCTCLVNYVLSCPMSLVPYVLSCHKCLVPYVLSCLTCLVPYVPSFLTCLVPYVLSCLPFFMPYVLSRLTYFVPYLLSYLTCFTYSCTSCALSLAFSLATRTSCRMCSFAPHLPLASGAPNLTYLYCSF